MVRGTYKKDGQDWEVTIKGLELQAIGPSPLLAFKSFENVIAQDLGKASQCTFRLHDRGYFDLTILATESVLKFITDKMSEQNVEMVFLNDLEEE